MVNLTVRTQIKIESSYDVQAKKKKPLFDGEWRIKKTKKKKSERCWKLVGNVCEKVIYREREKKITDFEDSSFLMFAITFDYFNTKGSS